MGALELQFHVVGNLQHHKVVFQLVDLAQDAAGGDHLVALVQGRHHFGMLFLSLALGPDGDDIEQYKQAYQEENLEQVAIGRASST